MGNQPWIQAPWIDQNHRVIIKGKDQAIRDTTMIAGAGIVSLYTEESVAKRLAAIAVVQRTGIVTQVLRRDSIGVGIYAWGIKCGDNSDSSCSKVRSGASRASSTAGGIFGQPAGSPSDSSWQ